MYYILIVECSIVGDLCQMVNQLEKEMMHQLRTTYRQFSVNVCLLYTTIVGNLVWSKYCNFLFFF